MAILKINRFTDDKIISQFINKSVRNGESVELLSDDVAFIGQNIYGIEVKAIKENA